MSFGERVIAFSDICFERNIFKCLNFSFVFRYRI